MPNAILILNAGSSSIKFGVFDEKGGDEPATMFRGSVTHIDDEPRLDVKEATGKVVLERTWPSPQSEQALIEAMLNWLVGEKSVDCVAAVGHRIVHGGSDFIGPTLLTKDSIDAIARLTPLAPLHQERCLSPARTLMNLRPSWVQFGCFDTAFHATLRPPASRFPIPRRFEQAGLRRYGFHGLSFEYIARELERLAPGSQGKSTVIAHLGNGASLCALRDSRSLDTTMGLTPLDGLMMGTRSGTVDPGLVLYLQQTNGMSAAEVEHMLYHDAGLLGVSGISSDMQKLFASDQPEAKQAIDLFTFIAAKDISAMACTLGGLERLVFTGGIGEHSADIRENVSSRLSWLGVSLDIPANDSGAEIISAATSKVEIRVIPTNEEQMMATHVREALHRLA